MERSSLDGGHQGQRDRGPAGGGGGNETGNHSSTDQCEPSSTSTPTRGNPRRQHVLSSVSSVWDGTQQRCPPPPATRPGTQQTMPEQASSAPKDPPSTPPELPHGAREPAPHPKNPRTSATEWQTNADKVQEINAYLRMGGGKRGTGTPTQNTLDSCTCTSAGPVHFSPPSPPQRRTSATKWQTKGDKVKEINNYLRVAVGPENRVCRTAGGWQTWPPLHWCQDSTPTFPTHCCRWNSQCSPQRA